MNDRTSVITREAALWGAAGVLVLAAHIAFGVWITRQAEAAAPPGLPEPVFVDLMPAPEPAEAPAAEQTVGETKPEPEPEPEAVELPPLQELEPIENFSELFPEPQEEEVTPPEVESTPELTLNSSNRPMRRPPEPEPEPEPAEPEPRREPEPKRQTQRAPEPQQQPTQQPAGQQAPQGAAGQGASGNNQQQVANLLQQWGGRIGACIQRRARLPRGVHRGGTVTLALAVSRNGTVQVRDVTGSSGRPELDQAAVQAAQRAGRCPPAPAGLTDAAYSFALPIRISQ